MKNKFSMGLFCWQILLLLSIFSLATSSLAQTSKINWDRMNRDLEIMQGRA